MLDFFFFVTKYCLLFKLKLLVVAKSLFVPQLVVDSNFDQTCAQCVWKMVAVGVKDYDFHVFVHIPK